MVHHSRPTAIDARKSRSFYPCQYLLETAPLAISTPSIYRLLDFSFSITQCVFRFVSAAVLSRASSAVGCTLIQTSRGYEYIGPFREAAALALPHM